MNSEDICKIVISLIIVSGVISVTSTIKSCDLQRDRQFLEAGCEQNFSSGLKPSVVWQNCKKNGSKKDE